MYSTMSGAAGTKRREYFSPSVSERKRCASAVRPPVTPREPPVLSAMVEGSRSSTRRRSVAAVSRPGGL